jgi:hypothetical protein
MPSEMRTMNSLQMRILGRKSGANRIYGMFSNSVFFEKVYSYSYYTDRLVNAPRLEAIEIVGKLYAKDSENSNNKLRMVLFNLAKFINEDQFANEFLQRGGLKAVVEVINSSHGNPLAVSPPNA